MPDVHDLAVLYDVFLAFQPQSPFLAGRGHATRFEQLIPRDYFSADEMLLEVLMDGAGGLLRRGAAADIPGAALLFAHREEYNQSQQSVGSPYQPVATRLL